MCFRGGGSAEYGQRPYFYIFFGPFPQWVYIGFQEVTKDQQWLRMVTYGGTRTAYPWVRSTGKLTALTTGPPWIELTCQEIRLYWRTLMRINQFGLVEECLKKIPRMQESSCCSRNLYQPSPTSTCQKPHRSAPSTALISENIRGYPAESHDVQRYSYCSLEYLEESRDVQLRISVSTVRRSYKMKSGSSKTNFPLQWETVCHQFLKLHILLTRRYGGLRPPTSRSCGGLVALGHLEGQ